VKYLIAVALLSLCCCRAVEPTAEQPRRCLWKPPGTAYNSLFLPCADGSYGWLSAKN